MQILKRLYVIKYSYLIRKEFTRLVGFSWRNGYSRGMVLSEFELQSHYHVHFWTNNIGVYEPPYLPSYRLTSNAAVLLEWMALALNNPQRLICQETKANSFHTYVRFRVFIFDINHSMFLSHFFFLMIVICSLLDKYPWGKVWTPYPPVYWLNSITTVLLKGWIWY